MWFQLNTALRQRAPRVHAWLKQATVNWRNSGLAALPVPVVHSGELFFLHPSFMTYSQWEPHVQSFLRSVLQRGDVVMDVGAHVGFHTIFAARLVGKTGRVLAFEPSPENFKLLNYHCRVNWPRNITTYSDIVGNAINPATAFVLVDGGQHTGNSITIVDDVPYITEQQKTVIHLPMTTVDAVYQKTGLSPTVIKIDVEGAELYVLEGAREVIRQQRPMILLGVHPFWLPQGQHPDDIVRFFDECEYTIADFNGVQVRHLEFGDYIAQPNEKPPLPMLSLV